MYHILCYAVLQAFITTQIHSNLQLKLFYTTAGLSYTLLACNRWQNTDVLHY